MIPSSLQSILNKKVTIDDYQATFIIFLIDGQKIRIDFIDKREFVLKKKTSGQLLFFEKHPLLNNYNEKLVTTYINSKPDNIDSFVSDIQRAINDITLGCRDWITYVENKQINFTLDSFLNNLKNGQGRFLEAPVSITKKVIEVCEKHGVSTKSFEVELKSNNYTLLTIDGSYVIAKEFKQHI